MNPEPYTEDRRHRGPVKGYAEMLRQRLEATENALLRLLLAADEKTILAAYGNGSDSLEDSSGLQVTIPPDILVGSELKKAALAAHWDQFPLQTVEDVKRWAKEVLRSPMAPLSENFREMNVVVLSESEPNQRVDASHTYSAPIHMAFDDGMSVPEGRANGIERRGHGQKGSGSGPETAISNFDKQPQASGALQDQLMSTESILQNHDETESLELPDEFRRQYLW